MGYRGIYTLLGLAVRIALNRTRTYNFRPVKASALPVELSKHIFLFLFLLYKYYIKNFLKSQMVSFLVEAVIEFIQPYLTSLA